MTKYCPDCGCPLQKTSYDRNWCPHCFKIIEEQESSTKDSYDGYFG